MAVKRRRDSDGGGAGATKNGANGQAQVDPPLPQQRQRREEELPQVQEEVGFESRQSHINYELGDTPGLVPIVLIQGPSFVCLAPALAIINSPEFQELNGNNFRHIMKELQGALIISSAFQAILGYTGVMSLLLSIFGR